MMRTLSSLRAMELHAELQGLGVMVRDKRDSVLMQLIGAMFFLLGKRRWFLDATWTTIGPRTIWAPRGTPLDRLDRYEDIVRHELVHIAQARRWPILWQLGYLLLLPAGLAYVRWRSERAAYLVQIRMGTRTVEDVVKTLGGIGYLWCWPRPWMRRWFAKAVQG